MADASLTRKTMIGAMWLTLWRAFTRAMGLGSTLVLARVLVPADFGLLAMASAFSGALDALSELGLQDALVRRRGDDPALYDTAFTLQLVRALLTGCVLAAGAPLAADWFNEPRLVPILLILAAGSAVAGLENIGIAEFRRNMRFDVQFRLLLVPRLLQVATTIPLAFALRSYWALLIGIVASKLARTAMTYAVHPYRPRLRIAGWRELAGFSFWTWATSAASLVWDRCDPFVLGPRLGSERLGVYLIGVEIAVLPMTELIAPVSDALFAGFAVAQKGGRSSVHHAPAVAATMLMGLAPLIIGLSCAAGDVVALLLGPKWAEAQPLVSIVAWQSLFSPFSYVCSAVMIANGHVRANFVGNVVVSAVKLTVLLVAVSVTSRLEVIAAASAACFAAESAVYVFLLKSVADVRLRDIAGRVLRTLLAGAATVLILAVLGLGWRSVTAPPLAAMADGAVIGAVTVSAYGLSLLALWRLAGQPGGAEADALAIVARRLRRLRAPAPSAAPGGLSRSDND